MNKLAKALFVAAAGALVAAALTLPSALAGPTVSYSQEVYKVTVKSPDGATVVPEWTSLKSGTWRADVEGQSLISSDGSYVVIDSDSGSVYHRTGSPNFMGDLHGAPEGVLALRAYLKGDPTLGNRGLHLAVGQNKAGQTTLDARDSSGKQAFTVTIEDKISDQDAEAAHLLDANPSQPQVTDTELAVGQAPTDGVKAYWFGRGLGTLHAAAAAEHKRTRSAAQIAAGMGGMGEGSVDVTFYEAAGVQATGAQPGLLHRPKGEIQVTSEPIGSAHAQHLIAAFDGTNGDQTYPAWPRSTVTLANGERATVVPDRFDGDGAVRPGFFVLTSTTLIGVSGDIAADDISSTAAKLRPLG